MTDAYNIDELLAALAQIEEIAAMARKPRPPKPQPPQPPADQDLQPGLLDADDAFPPPAFAVSGQVKPPSKPARPGAYARSVPHVRTSRFIPPMSVTVVIKRRVA
jgi:hypothetical protein